MQITNIFKTKNGFLVKNLILNESRTVLIGSVQDRDDLTTYISTKWHIDREKMVAICDLGVELYDLDITNKYLPQPEIKKPIKNFYTFNKDAWHCKLYKWVYGKEPHKVHPTMCPYFWIMVITLLVFPIILIFKMFGKAGTKYLEAMSTYRARRKERERQREEKRQIDWIEKVKSTWHKFSLFELEEIRKSSEWDKWKYYLGHVEDERAHMKGYTRSLEDVITSKYYSWKTELSVARQQKQEEARVKEEAIAREKAKNAPPKVYKYKEEKPKKKYNPDSKTSKIAGIGIIVLLSSYVLYLLGLGAIHIYDRTDWAFIGFCVLMLVGIVVGCVAVYFATIYLVVPFYLHVWVPIVQFLKRIIIKSSIWILDNTLEPFYKHVMVAFYNGIITPFVKYTIVIPIRYTVVKPTQYCGDKLSEVDCGSQFEAIGNGITSGMRFIGFLLSWPFVTLYKGFLYAAEFFKMCKDLIYQMYKNNCPRITWVEENNN